MLKSNSTLVGKKLFIRADASNLIGTGHIMRCLSIGQSWYELGGKVYFVVNEIPNVLQKRLIEEGFKVFRLYENESGSLNDAKKTVKKYQEMNGDCIMVDGYHFLGSYQEILKCNELKTIVVDDHHYSDYYCSDIILNKGLNAKRLQYKTKNLQTIFLLGPEYTTLRKEFLQQNRQREFPNIAKQILITFGGSDPKNITLRVIKNMLEISEKLSLKIVIGSAYKNKEKLIESAEKLKGNYEILTNVEDMGSLMASSDLAITAGGTTLYELAYMGLPSLTIKTASNQQSAKYFAELYKSTIYLGDEKSVLDQEFSTALKIIFDKICREQIGNNCYQLVDGYGNQRVITGIAEIIKNKV